MTFSNFMNALYDAAGAGESLIQFFKTFFKEITNDEISEEIFPKADAIRKYIRGDRNPRKFLQEIYSAIDSDSLKEYLSDIFENDYGYYDDNTISRLQESFRKNEVEFKIDKKDIVETLAEEFQNIVNQVIYSNDDKDRIKIKGILEKIDLMWGFMYSTGVEISEIPRSPYHPFIVNPQRIEPRKKLYNYFERFQELNEKLIPYIENYPKMEKLYQLSLEIHAEGFEKRINIPEYRKKYYQLLKELLDLYK